MQKKVVAIVTSAVLALGAISASAAWVSAGYDTTDLNNIGKIYNEIVDGNYTSKIKVEPVAAEDIKWVTEGYELEYPHAGYDRLYLEGNAQKITRYNNLFPQWETRLVDCFWEIGGNHRIYQRQQTKIPGLGWRWDYSSDPALEAMIFVPTTRTQAVDVDYRPYGIGRFDLKGNLVSDEIMAMYDAFGVYATDYDVIEGTKEIAPGSFFHNANLSALDETGHFVVSDAEIALEAGLISSKFLTGPDYGNGGSITKDAAAEYLAHPYWQWAGEEVVKAAVADIDWTAPMFEVEEPYNMYQYLIINGLVFDGSNDLPRIFRYTGGKATPTVEWKFAFPEAAYPYSIVEAKYINGKLALDEDGNAFYRIPTGQFANSYVKTTDTEIQIWLDDGHGDQMIAAIDRTHDTLGSYAGYTNAADWASNY